MKDEVWIVNMGIGENVEDNKPMRMFSTKKKAYAWVREMFEEQIKSLNEHEEGSEMGLGIGNSFHIHKAEVDIE